jgi:hypothetical protein
MSRTMHHVRYKHWNIKRPDYYWGYADDQYEKVSKRSRRVKPGAVPGWVMDPDTVGVELYDLRFYAGCNRVPQVVYLRREEHSYTQTWGHHGGAARGIAKEKHGQHRAQVREYGRNAVKVYRSGGDTDDMIEPEGRTRHTALWEAL